MLHSRLLLLVRVGLWMLVQLQALWQAAAAVRSCTAHDLRRLITCLLVEISDCCSVHWTAAAGRAPQLPAAARLEAREAAASVCCRRPGGRQLCR